MPNNPESEDLEIVISYPSYSDIEFGSSLLKATSIDYEGVPKFDHIRIDLHRWPVKFGIYQFGISC